jgi:predicted transcriptional regulator
MAKALSDDVLNAFVLYLVNVSQPRREIDITNDLRGTQRFSNRHEDTFSAEVRRALVDLIDQGYMRQTLDGKYAVTYSGIQFLTERRVAFPRDKNRLYFLKEAIRRRG